MLTGRDAPYRVWHAELMQEVRHVAWVTDDPPEYCTIDQPPRVVAGEVSKQIHKARRIDIHADRRLVVINPVQDDEAERIDGIMRLAAAMPTRMPA